MNDQNLEVNADYIQVLQRPPIAQSVSNPLGLNGRITFTDGGTAGFGISTTSSGGTAYAQSITVSNAATARSNLGAAAKASPAITGATIPLAKITGGGANGSITVNAEGIVTAYVAPT